MIKVAILIPAHRNPTQVARLCNRLKHESVDIYLHIDLKSNIAPFKRAINNVTFIDKRVDVLWGDFSQVQATLNSLAQIRQSVTRYDYVMMISGQDYPLQPISRIVEQLTESIEKQYIYGRILTKGSNANRCYQNNRYIFHNRLLTRASSLFMRFAQIKKRKYPFEDVWKGSSWWCLTGNCIDYILDYCDKNPQYVKFHKRVSCADEFFFQNIVVRSPLVSETLESESSHFMYMDWSAGKANPKTFTCSDYQAIVANGNWFARKFDADLDAKILDRLDAL